MLKLLFAKLSLSFIRLFIHYSSYLSHLIYLLLTIFTSLLFHFIDCYRQGIDLKLGNSGISSFFSDSFSFIFLRTLNYTLLNSKNRAGHLKLHFVTLKSEIERRKAALLSYPDKYYRDYIKITLQRKHFIFENAMLYSRAGQCFMKKCYGSDN